MGSKQEHPVDPVYSREMSNKFLQAAIRVVFTVVVLITATPVHAATTEGDWFLQAGATGDGKSITSPSGSSARIESQSDEGDTIVLLSADSTLDGGIALKAGQKLIGVSDSGRKPTMTNSNSTRNGGCGVVLADDNHVRRVLIACRRCHQSQ